MGGLVKVNINHYRVFTLLLERVRQRKGTGEKEEGHTEEWGNKLSARNCQFECAARGQGSTLGATQCPVRMMMVSPPRLLEKNP